MNKSPTPQTYDGLARAYDHFNVELFGAELPPCLITLQRRAKAKGYFAGDRFGSRDGAILTDEIALNPDLFAKRTLEETLSTLAHEMAHLWQHHFGKPSRGGYHNREWATKMLEIGLVPSATGWPGGAQVGPRMTHYIEAGGAYQRAFEKLSAQGVSDLYVDNWTEAKAKIRAKKSASKTKFTCPNCEANLWGVPTAPAACSRCWIPMRASGWVAEVVTLPKAA